MLSSANALTVITSTYIMYRFRNIATYLFANMSFLHRKCILYPSWM